MYFTINTSITLSRSATPVSQLLTPSASFSYQKHQTNSRKHQYNSLRHYHTSSTKISCYMYLPRRTSQQIPVQPTGQLHLNVFVLDTHVPLFRQVIPLQQLGGTVQLTPVQLALHLHLQSQSGVMSHVPQLPHGLGTHGDAAVNDNTVTFYFYCDHTLHDDNTLYSSIIQSNSNR